MQLRHPYLWYVGKENSCCSIPKPSTVMTKNWSYFSERDVVSSSSVPAARAPASRCSVGVRVRLDFGVTI